MRVRLLLLACFAVGVALSMLLQDNRVSQATETEPMLLMTDGGEILYRPEGVTSVPAVNHLLLSSPVLQLQIPVVAK